MKKLGLLILLTILFSTPLITFAGAIRVSQSYMSCEKGTIILGTFYNSGVSQSTKVSDDYTLASNSTSQEREENLREWVTLCDIDISQSELMQILKIYNSWHYKILNQNNFNQVFVISKKSENHLWKHGDLEYQEEIIGEVTLRYSGINYKLAGSEAIREKIWYQIYLGIKKIFEFFFNMFYFLFMWFIVAPLLFIGRLFG